MRQKLAAIPEFDLLSTFNHMQKFQANLQSVSIGTKNSILSRVSQEKRFSLNDFS